MGNAYTFENYTKKEEIILVFDLGGGFLSVSIISLEHGLIEVSSVNGNNDIGGEDFLERLFNYCFLEFKKKTGIDIKDNRKALNRLKKSCEDAIKHLSIAKTTTIDIESLANGKFRNRNYSAKI